LFQLLINPYQGKILTFLGVEKLQAFSNHSTNGLAMAGTPPARVGAAIGLGHTLREIAVLLCFPSITNPLKFY
jgi:hypothetical protein